MKAPRLLLYAAWLIHVVAWFLPAVTADVGEFGKRSLMGWQAFAVSFLLLFSLGNILPALSYFLNCVGVFSTLFLILGSPWLLTRWCARFRLAAGIAALVACTANLHWWIGGLKGFDKVSVGVGYFLWLSSFLVLGSGLIWLSEENYSSQPERTSETEPLQSRA